MKFDIEKVFRGEHRYDRMSPEELSFQRALGFELSTDLRTIDCSSYYRHKKDTIHLRIKIDEEGRVSHKLNRRGNKDKAVVKIETIDHLIEDTIYFLSVFADYGYLIPEKPEIEEESE